MTISQENQPLVSMLVPSRKRFDLLKSLLSNILDTTYNIENIEILIKFDADDLDSINRIAELPFEKLKIKILISDRGQGYADLHTYVNELCSMAKGTFISIINDDMIINSNHWDKYIEKYKNEICVLRPYCGGVTFDAQNLFPIVHKRIIDALGHFSLHSYNDCWMEKVAHYSDIQINLNQKDFEIIHNRWNNEDEVYQDLKDQLSDESKKFFSSETQNLILQDCYIVKNLIEQDDLLCQKLIKAVNNDNNKKILFYGAGNYAEKLISLNADKIKDLNIIGLIDKDISKSGSTIDKYKIYHIDDLPELNPDIIVISTLLAQSTYKVVNEYLKNNNINAEIITRLIPE